MAIKKFQDLTLADDFMFGEVMRRPENVKPFLEALLNIRIAEINVIDKQKDLDDTYDFHGIRLDVYLEDENRTKYDVEMQRTLRRCLEKRVRYYQSGIDRRTLESGEDYEELKDSYVIFVCANDYFGRGLAVYEKESHVKGAPELAFEDGSHALILNANFTEGNANQEVLEFLKYIRAGYEGRNYDISGSQYLKQIDHTILDLKKLNEEEVKYMTIAMKMNDVRKEGIEEGLLAGLAKGRQEGLAKGRQEGRQEGLTEGLNKGLTKGQAEIVKRMYARGRSLEEISGMTDLPLEKVKQLVEQE